MHGAALHNNLPRHPTTLGAGYLGSNSREVRSLLVTSIWGNDLVSHPKVTQFAHRAICHLPFAICHLLAEGAVRPARSPYVSHPSHWSHHPLPEKETKAKAALDLFPYVVKTLTERIPLYERAGTGSFWEDSVEL